MSVDDDVGYALGMRLPLDTSDRVEIAARELLAGIDLIVDRQASWLPIALAPVVQRLRRALDAAAGRRMRERVEGKR